MLGLTARLQLDKVQDYTVAKGNAENLRVIK